MSTPKYFWSYTSISITLGLLIGISLTYTVLKEVFIQELITPAPIQGEYIRDSLFKKIDSERIEFFLKKFKSENSFSKEGMDANTLFVYNYWSKLGFKTNFANYTVLTSHQNEDKPNSVIKYDKNGQILYISAHDSQHDLAYSPPTESPLNGTPIYVNFGNISDFIYLSQKGVSVRQNIVIARYSNIPPGDILKLAEEQGALALILFQDRYSYSNLEEGKNGTHENLGVRHVLRGGGDPQTPFYPSTDNAYKLPIPETTLPKIPAISLSYKDAMQILKGLKGEPTPSNWRINSDNPYLGPGYEDESYLTLEVNTYLKQELIHNVIGVIEGCIEPDRYVIVGSGGNTITGTAALIVLSEAFAKTMKSKNWCPQRTIIFCSWGPQQYRSISSTEWLEENQLLLEKGAVAYLSVDLEIRGNFTFMANSIPILYETIFTATKTVKNPNQEEVDKNELKTVYESYYDRRESPIRSDPDIGFNYVKSPFLQLKGIPVLEYFYDCDNRAEIFCESSPELVFNSLENNSNFSIALLKVYAETLRLLSDTPLLPFSESLYYNFANELNNGVELLKESEYFSLLNISLAGLESTVEEFKDALFDLREVILKINEQNDLLLRKTNDILINLEKTFIDDEGLPYTKHQKHVLYAPELYNSNKGKLFSGIYRLVSMHFQEPNDEIIDDLRKHISVIIFHLNSAIHLLRQTFNQI